MEVYGKRAGLPMATTGLKPAAVVTSSIGNDVQDASRTAASGHGTAAGSTFRKAMSC